jgi:hypothetical protein
MDQYGTLIIEKLYMYMTTSSILRSELLLQIDEFMSEICVDRRLTDDWHRVLSDISLAFSGKVSKLSPSDFSSLCTGEKINPHIQEALSSLDLAYIKKTFRMAVRRYIKETAKHEQPSLSVEDEELYTTIRALVFPKEDNSVSVPSEEPTRLVHIHSSLIDLWGRDLSKWK